MELSIRLFATLKDRAGKPRIAVPLAHAMTVSELLDTIASSYPELATTLPSSLVAVNRTFADPDTMVHSSDEVALFPPVSGG
jgi:molybdopterin converting factor subunit 1